MRRKQKLIKIMFIAVIVIVSLIIGINLIANSIKKDGKNEAAMVKFLLECGFEAEPQPVEIRKIQIPKQFGDAYRKYNDMQKISGFDLSKYRAKNAKTYIYRITNYPASSDVFAELIIINGKIVGGNLCSYSIEGFMLPLRTVSSDK